MESLEGTRHAATRGSSLSVPAVSGVSVEARADDQRSIETLIASRRSSR